MVDAFVYIKFNSELVKILILNVFLFEFYLRTAKLRNVEVDADGCRSVFIYFY